MIFSSNIFVYAFLPAVIAVYYVCRMIPRFYRGLTNIVLLIASMFFYTWGSGRYIVILCMTILIDYLMGLLIHSVKKGKKQILALSVIVNIGLLFWYKYFNFFLSNMKLLSSRLLDYELPIMLEVVLPIGISFYIFQALSYVIDVYKGTTPVQKNPFKLALYISFFPQLIAGPIVRYSEVAQDIDTRQESIDDFYHGFCRFVIGLSKKVLIADVLATSVNQIFSLPDESLTFVLTWTGIILYTLQIYFDFSGYSDMAIGMARIFGFHFNENFILPYCSENITVFWRKWHISLSSFLRDYVYIPLGGNRQGNVKTYRNLAAVFFLCGIWHGAAWTFVVWGIYHGILLIMERILRYKFNFQMSGILGRCVTLFLVMISWTIFRAESFAELFACLKAMFGFADLETFQYYKLSYYVTPVVACSAIVGIITSCFEFTKLKKKLEDSALKGIVCIALLALCMVWMSDATFNAFIYFKF